MKYKILNVIRTRNERKSKSSTETIALTQLHATKIEFHLF